MSGARYYKTGNIHVVEVPASTLKIKLVDKGKRDCGTDMVNASFFGVFGGEEYTFPVGHLVADYEAASANTRCSCEERGKFEGERFRFDCGSFDYKNKLYGKVVTTLVIRDGEAGVLDLEHAPLFDQCDYAVSGIPVMLDGKDVKWKDYVSRQGWDESSLRATLHSFVGLKADPETVYIMAWESKTSNLIYSAEAFKVFSTMGFRDVIKLDGGGSTILRAGGVTVATSGNRTARCTDYEKNLKNMESMPYMEIEINDPNVEIYETGGIDHHIMSDVKQEKVMWYNGEWECYIAGELSRDDLLSMIDSIYKQG